MLTIIGACASLVSLLTSIVAIVVVITKLRANVDALNSQETRMSAKIEQSTKDITNLLVEFKSFFAEQTTVNKFVAKALEGVVNRCEECRNQSTQQDGMAGLLAEILRHKQIVNIDG